MTNISSTIKVLITGNYTLDFISKSFEQYCNKNDLEIQIYKLGFNQYRQEILSKDSILYTENLNIVFISLDLYNIVEDLIFINDKEIITKMVDRLDEELRLIELICANLPNCHFFIDNFYYYRPISMVTLEFNSIYSFSEIEDISNKMLQNIIVNTPNANLIDVKSLLKAHGGDKLFDDRMYYISKSHWSLSGAELLSNLYLRYLNAYLGKRRKCIVLDLDNTLWGGIIGDDGIENIILSSDGQGKAFYDFQRELLKLYHRGILLAICSKNTEEIALEVLQKHPHMVLRSNNFVSKKINWKNKAENLKEIAEELNIGLESVVFFDDSSFERENIIKQFPQVYTPKLPEDPSEYVNFLRNLEVFDFLELTGSDITRNKVYFENSQREKTKSNSINIEDYYMSLQMIATIGTIGKFHVPRIAQLTQKTNQFNLRTIRYNEQDIILMKQNPSYRIYYLSLIDKFGDNGIVGTAIVKLKNDIAFIDTFILSCRVLGRTVESALLNHIITDTSRLGINKIEGEYLETNRNLVCADFLTNHGFNKINETEWLLDIDSFNIKKLPWIKINEENYEK